ncbi:MAG TPA: Mur ligase family protein [Desulfosporosinus sp.]
MELAGIRFYEGYSLKREKHLVELCIKDATHQEIRRLCDAYVAIFQKLGFEENFIGLADEKEHVIVWLRYSQEDTAKYVLTSLIHSSLSQEDIIKNVKPLLDDEFLYQLSKKSAFFDIPVLKLCKNIYQFGYGKSSEVLGISYQSYENMPAVLCSLNRAWLYDQLQYNNIPAGQAMVIYSVSDLRKAIISYPVKVCNMDKTNKTFGQNTVHQSVDDCENDILSLLSVNSEAYVYTPIENYRMICIEGIIKEIFPLYNNLSDEYIPPDVLKKEFEAQAINIYKWLPIKFMYIDVTAYVTDTLPYKIVVNDVGSVFDIRKQLDPRDSDTLQMLLLDYLKSKGIGSIPIFSISGTNGKTTTARLINDLLLMLGYSTGLACTGYITFGRNLHETGDTTGFLSARTVLTNKTVEAAVFETARGGILRNGLGYEGATAAILTTISEDHINGDNIQSIKDLAQIKSILLEEVHPFGKWIIRAQKELIEEAHTSFTRMTERGLSTNSFEEMVCLFSIEKNEFVCDHISRSGEAFYTSGDNIIHHYNGHEVKLINYKELEFTHYGMSKGNVKNVMAALAALTTLPVNTQAVLDALTTIPCDYRNNVGRQNILVYKDFKILVDYGHNAEAYHEIYSIVREMQPSYVTSVLSAPGDRQDKYIEELGYIAGKTSNFVVLREHQNQRGSKEGRVSSLMKKGAVRAGLNENQFITILEDIKAFEFAVEKAIKNEIIVFFTETPENFISKVLSCLSL